MTPTQSLLLAFFGVVALVEGGVVPLHGENKIINGYEIDISRVPWQVSLLVNNWHNCGGSIISPQWVLSAAHCTVKHHVSELKIRIGSNSFSEGGKLYQVELVVNHEEYDHGIIFNDITLLKTATDMSLDYPVKAVTLPKLGAKRPPVKSPLLVSGWGIMENMEFATKLMAVDVEVRRFEECKSYYNPADESTQICAGLPRKGFCSSDSGGPLMKGELLVGIVSYMADIRYYPCGELPGVYTDVAVYRQWIKAHTGL